MPSPVALTRASFRDQHVKKARVRCSGESFAIAHRSRDEKKWVTTALEARAGAIRSMSTPTSRSLAKANSARSSAWETLNFSQPWRSSLGLPAWPVVMEMRWGGSSR